MNKIVTLLVGTFAIELVFALASCEIELAFSDESTQILNGTSNYQNAAVVTDVKDVANLTNRIPNAKWIWVSNTLGLPPMSILIRKDFTVDCPGIPITLAISVPAGVYFSFELNGASGSGVGPGVFFFNISTTGVSCGTTILIEGEILTLIIHATSSSGVPKLLYSIWSENCPWTNCQCPNCSKTIPGCLTCVCDTFCSSCDIKNFWKYDPVDGECVCIDGYYKNQNNKCVPCPEYMYCKTCTFSRIRGRVECKTCPCEQKRILYPESMYCGCANGTECCNFKGTVNQFQPVPPGYKVSPCCM